MQQRKGLVGMIALIILGLGSVLFGAGFLNLSFKLGEMAWMFIALAVILVGGLFGFMFLKWGVKTTGKMLRGEFEKKRGWL